MPSYKIARVEEIEVFPTQHGEITISQEAREGESPAMVVVPRDLVARLIRCIQNAAEELDATKGKPI